MIDLNLYKEAFKLANKSWSIVIFSLLQSVFVYLMIKYPLLSFPYMFFVIGWVGVQIKLINNIKTTGHANWRHFFKYWGKYFIRFLPFMAFAFLFGFLFTLILVPLMILGQVNAQNVPQFFSSLYTDIKIWIPIMVVGSWIYPYIYMFPSVVVVKDTSFFGAFSETFKLLGKNRKIYFHLVLAYITLTLVSKIFVYLPGTSVNSVELNVVYIIRMIIFSYLATSLTSLCILGLNKTQQ